MKTKFTNFNRAGLAAMLMGMAASWFVAKTAAAKTMPDPFSVQTRNFALNFEAGDPGS